MHKDRPSVLLRSGGLWQEVLFGRSDTISHIIDRKCGGVGYCSKVNMIKVQWESCFFVLIFKYHKWIQWSTLVLFS